MYYQAEKIMKVLFFLGEQRDTPHEEIEWDSWHRKVVANITKGMDPFDRKGLYFEILRQVSDLDIKLKTKQKQAIKRLLFPRGKLKQEQDEELRILNRGF